MVKPRCARATVHHTCAEWWGDSQGCHAYRCGDGWHFGHKPAALIRGLIRREDIA